MLKFAKLFLIAFLFTACSNEPEPKPTTPLVIKTTEGEVRFMVEVANTPEELKTGLMHRTNLGFNSGMIFNIYPVRPTAMWMKNTKIPLDMLFVAPDATISMIKENAEPMSEELIISKEPVRAVIEINAGQVKRHGIKIGDKVTHMLLNSMVDIKTPGPEAQTSPQPATPSAQSAPKAEIPVPTLKVEPKEPSTPQAPAQITPQAPNTKEAETPTIAPIAPEPPIMITPQAPTAPVAPATTPKLPVPAPAL